LNGFVNTGVLPEQNSVDSAVSFVSNILIETAKQAGMQVRKGAVPRRSAQASESFKRLKHPKWHNDNCHEKFRQLKQTSMFLKNDPKNAYLRGKLNLENKEYNRLIKFKQFTDSLLSQLETMHKADPRNICN
jgi:ribosomal protein S10